MISLKNISFGYTSKLIIKDFSLDIQEKDLCLVSGKNGTGKSTLLNIIVSLLKPQKGEVLTKSPIEYLAAEKNGLLLSQVLASNLQFWRSLSGLSQDSELLDKIIAKWKLNTNVFTQNLSVMKFSTGMKRRLALARVEYSTKPCWVLDEPTFGLDQDGVQTLQQTLQAHLSSGGCAVVVTHNPEWLSKLTTKTVSL